MEDLQQASWVDGPPDAPWTVLLAHGAGTPADSPFMAGVAREIAGAGLRVVRFEFPYMRWRRARGARRPPDPMPVLLEALRAAVPERRAARLAVGGKSMGGRVASLAVAEGMAADVLVCLGYPFHPPRRPERLRTGHLARLTTPTLVVQGTRDPFGSREEVAGYDLPDCVRVAWLEDADHDFRPRVRSGLTQAELLARAGACVAGYLLGV